MFALLAGVSLVAQTVVPSAGVFGADYSQELRDAYDWAYSKGVTTMSSIDNANMYGAITRAQMAKMLSVYAKEVLGNTPDTSKACEFGDIDSVKGDLHDFIIESCQLGIMGQGIKNFRPYATITRAEFGTALSRVLWGDKYEGGTPYYAKHLDALKAAGIMTQIDNPESRDEVRGYVMLMLMRSDEGGAGVDCDDPVVALACLDPELDAYKECPAACRDNGEEEDNKEDEVVKSGSLVVSAEATSTRSAIKGAASDLDTLTFKTSEEVSITKVVLERYGYSSPEDVANVRLENSDGTRVTEPKNVNSKDQVTLSIKKDYRVVDGSEDWTIVVELTWAASGSTIGFKVVDVTSTAKDVDLGNYRPYTYDIVTYDAVSVSIDDKGTNKDYNYEEGESYEVAKIKIKAGSSALEVNGFNLTNVTTGTKLDLKEFVDKVEVAANGETLKGASYTVNDDELDVAFDSYEVAAKWNAIFSVNITLKDFDEYNTYVKFAVANASDAKIVEKKTWARVSVTGYNSINWSEHQFVGSKIKLSSKKLGSVDAAQWSDDIVVLEGDIEIAEAIDRWSFTVTGEYSTGVDIIDEMKLVVAGDEYTATKAYAGTGVTFTFTNVEVEKSGKLQIMIDVNDDSNAQGATVNFVSSTINKNLIADGTTRYTEARKPVQASEVKWSISFATKITIQPSKASLENNLTKDVEFLTSETSKKVVFDGTYTAKKGDVYLNTVSMNTGNVIFTGDITFYVYIDGEEVAALDAGEEDTFSDILVKAGESVKVKVEAEVYADEENSTSRTYELTLKGDDESGNSDSGKASENTVGIKTVKSGTVNVTAWSSSDTVLLRARNTDLATFTIKPSNNNEGLTIDTITLTGKAGTTVLHSGDIRLKVDGVEYDADTEYTTGIVYVINEDLPSAGFTAEVVLKSDLTGDVELVVKNINDAAKFSEKTFKKSYADALVYIDLQENQGDFTQFRFAVEKFDESYEITGVVLWSWSLSGGACASAWELEGLKTTVSDGDKFTITNDGTSHSIKCISYYVDGVPYAFDSTTYADYFKVDWTAWRIFSNNN